MATIYGPSTGHAILHDTSGDDTIIAAGGYNTIYSLSGNDTISGGSIGYNTILAGTQYDQAQRDVSIRLNGLGNTVDGGDADFTIASPTGGTTVAVGNGANAITLGGQNNSVTVGWGRNVIVAGSGNDHVTVTGAPTASDSNPVGADNVTFAGTGNSFANDTSGTSPLFLPLSVLTTINGGSGDGTYSLWGGGTVLTGGADNTIDASAGTYHIVAGSGHDTVDLNPTVGVEFPTTASVRLDGTDNVVTGIANSATIEGGLGNTRVTLGSDQGSDGLDVINLGGSRNSVTMDAGQGRIDPGGDNAIVNLSNCSFQVFMHGTADFIGLGDGSGGSIEDQSQGLKIDVTGITHETIDNFGFDRGAVVRFDLGAGGTLPFGSVADVLAALHNTAGGAMLSYSEGSGGTGTILFAGLSASQLTASNFAV
jgi:hypothetical protein